MRGIDMKIRCDFCGSYFEDTESSCPCCGGINAAAGNRRFSNGVPKTIEELKQWAMQHNVPLDKMHVYIGDNNYSPKCIGIYKMGNEVTVYKNKSDGTRAVRYQGSDEAYAVNEVYLKIKEMMAGATKHVPDSNSGYRSYGGYSASSQGGNGNYGRNHIRAGSVAGIIITAIIVITLTASFRVCAGGVGWAVQSCGFSSCYSAGCNGNYNSGYGSHTSYWDWDYDYDDDSYDDDSDDDYDWDSDWDSDYGDYDWDFDYDWDSDW